MSLTLVQLGLFMQMGLLVQMAPLVEMCTLMEQVPLVQERISPQWAHPAVTQYGFSCRLVDTIYTQTDGSACHDRCLHKQTNANNTALTVFIRLIICALLVISYCKSTTVR